MEGELRRTVILDFLAGPEEGGVVVGTGTSAWFVPHPQLGSSCPKSLSVFILFSFHSAYKSKPA